jgi:hypothetical protein
LNDLQGTQGAQGIQGLSNQGTQGTFGTQGSLSNFQGTQGPQGVQGLQGTFGPPTIPKSLSSFSVSSSDNGKFIAITGGVSLGDVFTVGQNVVIYNNTDSQQQITAGVTLRLASTSLFGNRFIQQRGLATIICVDVGEYVISGAGVT